MNNPQIIYTAIAICAMLIIDAVIVFRFYRKMKRQDRWVSRLSDELQELQETRFQHVAKVELTGKLRKRLRKGKTIMYRLEIDGKDNPVLIEVKPS